METNEQLASGSNRLSKHPGASTTEDWKRGGSVPEISASQDLYLAAMRARPRCSMLQDDAFSQELAKNLGDDVSRWLALQSKAGWSYILRQVPNEFHSLVRGLNTPIKYGRIEISSKLRHRGVCQAFLRGCELPVSGLAKATVRKPLVLNGLATEDNNKGRNSPVADLIHYDDIWLRAGWHSP